MRSLNFALFGNGRIGSVHFHNLICNPRVNLKYVLEAGPAAVAKAREIVEKYKVHGCQVLDVKDSHLIYEDKSIDAVIICTPTDTHKDIVLKCLRSGKHVLCEKPVATDIVSISICYDEAEKAGRYLMCAFNRRFDPSLRAIKEAVQSNELGTIKVIKTVSRDPTPPPLEYLKICGGIFHDSTIHDIDYICWLVGQAPSEVYAQGHAFYSDTQQAGDVDVVAVVMKFPNGIIATVDQSRQAPHGYDQRVEVMGEKSMAVADFQRPLNIHKSDAIGTHYTPIGTHITSRYLDSYKCEMEHFLDVLEGTSTPIVKKEEVIMASRIADALGLSLKKGGNVTLSELM
ncbi:myo-inositol 2-dehydrogenase-like [Glandiceps talaboti]